MLLPIGLFGLALDGFGTDAEVDGWLKLDPLPFEGTAIDADIETGERQMSVLAGEPAVAKRVEILSASRPQLIDDLAGVIADRLAIRACYRDFLRTETVFSQRAQCGHEMDVGIAGGVMVDPVGDHALRGDVACHKVAHEFDVLLGGQLERQGYGDVLCELCVGSLFEVLYLVPERLGCASDRAIGHHAAHPFWRVIRDHERLMQEPLLAGVVDRPGFALKLHPGAMPVGRRQHGAAARATGDDADGEVRDGHGGVLPGCERHQRVRRGRRARRALSNTSRQRRIIAPLEAAPLDRP